MHQGETDGDGDGDDDGREHKNMDQLFILIKSGLSSCALSRKFSFGVQCAVHERMSKCRKEGNFHARCYV